MTLGTLGLLFYVYGLFFFIMILGILALLFRASLMGYYGILYRRALRYATGDGIILQARCQWDFFFYFANSKVSQPASD